MVTITLIIFFLFNAFYTNCQIDSVKEYKQLAGNQIYLWTDDHFIYISIDDKSSSKLVATFHMYFKSTFENIVKNTFYISIGLGQNQMSQADIILCSIMSDETYSCVDYDAKGWSLIKKSTQKVKLIKFYQESLKSTWLPYITYVSFDF